MVTVIRPKAKNPTKLDRVTGWVGSALALIVVLGAATAVTGLIAWGCSWIWSHV